MSQEEDFAWSPDDQEIAAAGEIGLQEGAIFVWDAQTGTLKQRLTAGMTGARLGTAAWSPDGRRLACGTLGYDGFVWDMTNNVPLARLKGPRDYSDELAWSPDGTRLVAGSRDGRLSVWDLTGLWK